MEWKEVIATDYCYKVADGTHDSPKRQNRGRFLITSKHIKGPSIDFDNAYYISEDDYQKIIKRSKIDKWDVIVSMIGEYCGFCYLEDSDFTDYAVKNVGILKVGERIKSLWLYYYLNSPAGRNQLKNTRAGSSQPYISLGSLRNLLIPEPPREVMESIVSILSSLDRKIELNDKINADLEEMAQAIFKNWFVDFEPFKDGKFVDSELGMIPEGWTVGCLGDMGNIVCGKTPSKSNSNYYGGDIPFIKIPDMHGNVFVENSEDRLTEEGSLSQIKKLIPPYSLMVSCIATVGLVSINTKPSHTNQQINTVIPHNKSALFYLYQHMKNNEEFLKNMGRGGTTTLNVNTRSFSNIRLLIPSEIALEQFHRVVEGLFKKIELNLHESRALSLLRDTLLPRLMSGELGVPE